MISSNYGAYARSASQVTHSQEKMLIMLYDGVLKFIKLAQRGIEEKKPALKGEYISRVIAIITELDSALDMDRGGEISENLSGIYGFMVIRLSEANLKNDPAALEEVAGLIRDIKEGFEVAAKSMVRSAPRPQAAEPQQARSICFAV